MKCVLTFGEVRTDPSRCPYRTIHLGIQGNSLTYTGKVLMEYRESA